MCEALSSIPSTTKKEEGMENSLALPQWDRRGHPGYRLVEPSLPGLLALLPLVLLCDDSS